MVSEPYGSRMITAMEAPSSNYKPKARISKTLMKYSCEEIEERMANGLCIFCEEQDTPGHHDLKHKGVKIFMIESDDQPILTEGEPIVDKYVTEMTLNPDAFSESVEGFTSDLQIIAAVQKEDQNKSDAEDIVSFSLGRKIEHMVVQLSQKFDRIWESGGFLAEPDPEMVQTEAVLHCQIREICVLPEKISQPCQHQKDQRVWEPGGFEIYGWKCNKQMIVLINQGIKVEEMFKVKVLQVSDIYGSCEEFEWLLRYGCKGTSIATSLLNGVFTHEIHPQVDLKACIGLEIFDGRFAKPMILSVYQGSEAVQSIIGWKVLENLYKHDRVLKCCYPLKVSFVEGETYIRELLIVGLRQLALADMKFHLKHKWRSRLLESFSGLEITMDHIVLIPSCFVNAYSVREQETKSGYPVFQENHALRCCVTMLKQCFLKILQLNKQETGKLSFSDRATTGSGHPLLHKFKSVLAHSTKNLSQVQVQQNQKLNLASWMFQYKETRRVEILNWKTWCKHRKCSSSIWHRWRNKYCDSCDLVKVEGLVLRHMSLHPEWKGLQNRNKSVSGMSRRQSIHCGLHRHVKGCEHKRMSFQDNWVQRVANCNEAMQTRAVYDKECTRIIENGDDIKRAIADDVWMLLIHFMWVKYRRCLLDVSFVELVGRKALKSDFGVAGLFHHLNIPYSDTHKLLFLIKGYGDRDIMTLRVVDLHSILFMLFYGSLPQPPDFRMTKKNLKRFNKHEKNHVLLLPKDNKLLLLATGFWSQYKDLEKLCTEPHSFQDTLEMVIKEYSESLAHRSPFDKWLKARLLKNFHQADCVVKEDLLDNTSMSREELTMRKNMIALKEDLEQYKDLFNKITWINFTTHSVNLTIGVSGYEVFHFLRPPETCSRFISCI